LHYIHPELYPHQKEALAKMHDGCILWGGVGSGKSRTALAYYTLTDAHEDVYVITTAKKRDSMDWEDEAVKFGIGKKRDATLYGTITIDSWNNIHKYVGVKDAFFIFDEQRLVGSGKWSKSFLKIAKSNRWIMLSATPGDTWLDYAPVFIANGFYRTRTEFKSEHVIFKPYISYPVVERYVNVGKLIKNRNQILVHMPFARQTIRHSHNVWCEYDEALMARVSHGLWNPYKDEPTRDKADTLRVMRQVVNSHPSRLVQLEKLVQRHPKLIVFYNFNFELDLLREFGIELLERSCYPRTLAEWNGHYHQEIPDTPEWLYFVQYMAGAEGWNCTSTDAMAFYSLPYSYKLFEQAHGRIDRLNTPFIDLNYYYLRSHADIDHAIWRSLKSKKQFQPNHFDMTNAEFADFSVK
jgi:hypothetical protein